MHWNPCDVDSFLCYFKRATSMQAPHQQFQPQPVQYAYPQMNAPMPRIGWVGPQLTKAGGFALAVIILSISGLIMDSSGVPWTWDEDRKSENRDDFKDYYPKEGEHAIVDAMIYDVTMWFILGLSFAVVLLALDLIPMHRMLRDCSQSLLGIALIVTGIFALRTFGFWCAVYFKHILNEPEVTYHLHAMVYFIGLFAITLFISGLVITTNRWRSLPAENSNVRLDKAFDVSKGILLACVIALVLSPILPIVHLSHDLDFDPETDRTHITGLDLLVDAQRSDLGEMEDSDNYLNVVENYDRLDSIFIAFVWIQAGIMAIICLAFIPGSKAIIESVAQLQVLILGLVIWMIVCNVLVYSAIPALDEDDGTGFSSPYYQDVTHNVNWLMPVSTIFVAIMWFSFLFRCHIPWWGVINQAAKDAEQRRNAYAMQQHAMAQQQIAAQQMAQQQQMYAAERPQQPPQF